MADVEGRESSQAEQQAEQQNEQQTEQPALEHINLTFGDDNGHEVSFKLKRTTPLGKAMHAYSAKTQRETTSLRFLFEGDKLIESDTAASKELEDGDKIDVHTEQIGGTDIETSEIDDEWLMVSKESDDTKPASNEQPAPKEKLAKIPEHISIVVQHYTHELPLRYYKVKSSAPMKRIYQEYATFIDVPLDELSFSYEGAFVHHNTRAYSFAMIEGMAKLVARRHPL